jgi:glycosyltransferase involved in cell wall biosynthesis
MDRVRLLRQEHQGCGAARNLGIAEARGEWIAFQDSDDLWKPDRLSSQFDLVARAPEVDFVFGNTESFGSSVDRLFDMVPTLKACDHTPLGDAAYRLEGDDAPLLARGNFISTPSVLVRTSALGDSRFDAALWRWQDFDLWLRLASRVPFGYVDRVLVRTGQHAGNASKDLRLVGTSALRMIRKAERGVYAIPQGRLRREVVARWGRMAFQAFLNAGAFPAATGAFRKSLVAPNWRATGAILRQYVARSPIARKAARLLRVSKAPRSRR